MKALNIFKTVVLLAAFAGLSINLSAQSWPPAGMNGSGTQSSPWEITTAQELADLAAYVSAGNGKSTLNKYYKLMSDIDLSGYASGNGWLPIGDTIMAGGTRAFRGNFDGNSKTVKNMSIDNRMYCGLFGYAIGATIENLGVESCTITNGRAGVGGLAGMIDTSSVISNCYVTGELEGLHGLNRVGGLVGESNRSTISNCYAAANIKFASSNNNFGRVCGGLVGVAQHSAISNCYSTADINISGSNAACGGLIGYQSGTTIENCVAANNSIRGRSVLNTNRICGEGSSNQVLRNNYALNTMTVQDINGNDISITEGSELAGISMDIEILKSLGFYTDVAYWHDSPWDMSSVWKMCAGENMFPILRWQKCDGETGIAEVQGIASVQVYPNPTTGLLIIKNEEINDMEVYDMMGRVVSAAPAVSKAGELSLDISHLPNGVYFLRIDTKKGIATQKIIKE